MKNKIHKFIDEAGDPNFFGKGGVVIIGQEGVSKTFSLGMVSIKNGFKKHKGGFYVFSPSTTSGGKRRPTKKNKTKRKPITRRNRAHMHNKCCCNI